MKIYHMSGAGNDFMVMDARGLSPDFSQLAVRLCAMTHADGFMAVGESREGDFQLHFYNSDGSRGEMCGNGARCICRFAYDMGIAGAEMVVQTDAGLVPGWRLSEDLYRVKLNSPSVLELRRREDSAYVELGCPGVPHCVTEVPGLEFSQKEQLRKRGKALRFDPAFPKGANVNFFCLTGEGTGRVLTYERGVEDYTLACGTGCGSVAAVLWESGRLPGGKITLENGGGALSVTVAPEREGKLSLLLEGPTAYLGEYTV